MRESKLNRYVCYVFYWFSTLGGLVWGLEFKFGVQEDPTDQGVGNLGNLPPGPIAILGFRNWFLGERESESVFQCMLSVVEPPVSFFKTHVLHAGVHSRGCQRFCTLHSGLSFLECHLSNTHLVSCEGLEQAGPYFSVTSRGFPFQTLLLRCLFLSGVFHSPEKPARSRGLVART